MTTGASASPIEAAWGRSRVAIAALETGPADLEELKTTVAPANATTNTATAPRNRDFWFTGFSV
jgi:hypothetical protein